MKKLKTSLVAAGLFLTFANGTASADSLRSLYETACRSNGIDEDQGLCILGAVSDNHSADAVQYLALDMNLRYDEAALLLEKIGEDEAFAVGNTFDRAQNLSCSSSRLAMLEGKYQAAGEGAVTSSAVAAENADDQTLSQMVSAPLQALRGPNPVLDFSSVQGDVNVIISLVMSSDLIAASRGNNIRPHLAWYDVVDKNGGVDLSGNGVADITPADPGYASAVQSRTLSPRLSFERDLTSEQTLGRMRFEGGKLYAPVMRLQLENASASIPSLGDLSNITSVEDLSSLLNAPRNVHFAFPIAEIEPVGSFNTAGGTRFTFDRHDTDADGNVTAADMIFTINQLN